MHSEDFSEDSEATAGLRILRPGELVSGRFLLESILGRGGMGVVWLARDQSLGGKPRALKFLTDAIAQDPLAVAELKEEVARCQELSHPHIIRVHDLVEDRDRGWLAISMEVAGGGSLNLLRSQRPHRWFEPEELRPWVAQLCAALTYAHEGARIVHRDLKPANLLLSERGELKVGDFGISHSLSESVTRLTGQQGPVSGTPAYMSPEQAQGRRARASDDIYALGATLYDLLTGKPPYLGNHHGVILTQILDSTTKPPSIADRRRELRDLDAPVPAAWEETIAACLAKDAPNRPQTAAEVAARLHIGFVAQPAAGSKTRMEGISPSISAAGTSRSEEMPMQLPKPAGIAWLLHLAILSGLFLALELLHFFDNPDRPLKTAGPLAQALTSSSWLVTKGYSSFLSFAPNPDSVLTFFADGRVIGGTSEKANVYHNSWFSSTSWHLTGNRLKFGEDGSADYLEQPTANEMILRREQTGPTIVEMRRAERKTAPFRLVGYGSIVSLYFSLVGVTLWSRQHWRRPRVVFWLTWLGSIAASMALGGLVGRLDRLINGKGFIDAGDILWAVLGIVALLTGWIGAWGAKKWRALHPKQGPLGSPAGESANASPM